MPGFHEASQITVRLVFFCLGLCSDNTRGNQNWILWDVSQNVSMSFYDTFILFEGDGNEEDFMGCSVCKQLLYNEKTEHWQYHHSQLMQIIFLLILSIVFCVSWGTITMENFNVNINGSTNSSAGSSEVSHEELLDLCAVGKLLTVKPVWFQFMEERLSSDWNTGQGVDITQAEANKFLFQFYHRWDMERIMQEGLWTYDGCLLILKKLSIGEAIADVNLDEVDIWVQVFNLPHGYMHEYMGMLVGCHMGRFVKFDEENFYGPWRMYMRIRVALNIHRRKMERRLGRVRRIGLNLMGCMSVFCVLVVVLLVLVIGGILSLILVQLLCFMLIASGNHFSASFFSLLLLSVNSHCVRVTAFCCHRLNKSQKGMLCSNSLR